jgi:CDP-4-dehydro-6-deoxyglucose reductase
MPTTWSECTFLKAEKISPNTQLFFFKVDTNFSFIAGQFITFDLPVSEKRSQRWKSFSIANSSFETNVIELCISHVDGGLATNFLFQEMKVGTKLKFKGPDGQFVFHEKNKDKNHIFICTGTGIVPCRSILIALLANCKSENIQHHLIFGTRFANGILYEEELKMWDKSNSHFRYDICLSKDPQRMDVYHGYVHQIYLNLYNDPSPNNIFYICGWQNMVDEAVENLKQLGYSPDQIQIELYG